MPIPIVVDLNDADLRQTFLNQTLPQAIDQLNEDSVRKWGQMTPQHMVEHLIWAFEVSRGEGQVDCPIPERLRQRMKAFLFNNMPTPQEFRNPAIPDELMPLRYPNLRAAVAALKTEINQFDLYTREHPDAVHDHTAFGPLSAQEWNRSHYKHCIHHLLQFGLVEQEETRAV